MALYLTIIAVMWTAVGRPLPRRYLLAAAIGLAAIPLTLRLPSLISLYLIGTLGTLLVLWDYGTRRDERRVLRASLESATLPTLPSAREEMFTSIKSSVR